MSIYRSRVSGQLMKLKKNLGNIMVFWIVDKNLQKIRYCGRRHKDGKMYEIGICSKENVKAIK